MSHMISVQQRQTAESRLSAWRCPSRAKHLVRVARSSRRDLLLCSTPLLTGPAVAAAAPSPAPDYLENVTPFARPSNASKVRRVLMSS